jgi:hypothetical protein
MKYLEILIIIISILIIIVYIFITRITDPYTKSPQRSLKKTWTGLCLFDIDGTLTTGTDNKRSIDICLQAGYAVGITTAGAMYTPENLLSFSWMPRNLYLFMKHHGFITFNNVASGVLSGKYNPAAYQDIKDLFNGQHVMWGVLKGRSLINTAKLYDITNPKQMILFDNDPGFLKGLSIYNPEIVGVCAGKPCMQSGMTPQIVRKALQLK